jgi:capsular polysaccharide biosynthesis protein
MDSSTNVNVREENELDIRDIANYLLGKIWIVILAIVCFAVVAIIFTSTITPMYTSNSTMFIINTQNSTSSQTTSDWTVGRQLAITSPELVDERFCKNVAVALFSEFDANSDFAKYIQEQQINIPVDEKEFDEFTTQWGKTIFSSLKVTSDEETCIVTFSATTTNPVLSKHFATVAADQFGDYINDFMNSNTIRTTVAKEGKVSNSPSNIHMGRNAILAGVVGAVLACIALIIVFMFDDKIKTADDIDRHLGLSVLGVIPEIDIEA